LFILLAALLGVVHGVAQYRYNSDNNNSLLPAVLRAMDPHYLPNDFYVNSTAEFGPRSYFGRLLALVATPDTLPVFYFLLNLLSNVGVALFSGLFARAMFHGSNVAAMCGAFAVMAATTFELGYTGKFGRATLVPSTLAQPLLVAALWAGFRGHPLACALVGVPASLAHPVLGPEATTLGLWLAAVAILGGKRFAFVRRNVVALTAGLGVLAAVLALLAARYSQSVDLDTRRFVELEAVFRNPHHTLATFFPPYDYAAAACFFAASVIAWQRWRNDGRTTATEAFAIGSVLVVLVMACVAGYIFVEVVPVRLVAIAQPFRMLLLAKILGVLLVAGWIAAILHPRHGDGALRDTVSNSKDDLWDAALLAAGLLSPFVLVVATVLLATRPSLRRVGWLHAISKPGAVALLVALSPLLLLPPGPTDAARLLAFGCVTTILLRFGDRRGVVPVVALLTLAGVAALFVDVQRWPRFAHGIVRLLQPQLSFADLSGSEADAARWAEQHTPADALFLVPPSHGTFRLLARRAILADFKSFPFQDGAMVEWQRRLLDCCGPLPDGSIGFAAAAVMEKNYRQLGDADLTRLAHQYGTTYALLFNTTATARPVVYANERLKIVRLAP
jgi:hypothetical protein